MAKLLPACSTQSPHTFRYLSASCSAAFNTIEYVFARVGRDLFQVPTLLPFNVRVHKFLPRRGNTHPTLFRNSRPKFDMEANQPFQQENLIKTPPCVAAPKIRQRTRANQLVLQDDWTTGTLINRRVLTMSSTKTLFVAHLDLSARGGDCFRHINYW